MTQVNHLLQPLRAEIDMIDQQLIKLLNQRAAISVTIGQIKKSDPTCVLDIKDDNREKNILANITQQNIGPLNDDQLIKLFECIMSQSRDLQSMIS